MGHEGDRNVVEDAFADQFGLAAEEVDAVEMGDAALLGGAGDEGDLPGEEFADFGNGGEAAGGAEHGDDLQVVAAGVGGVVHGVGVGILRHDEGVEFAEDRDRGPRFAGVEIGADPGAGQSGAEGKSHRPEGVGDLA